MRTSSTRLANASVPALQGFWLLPTLVALCWSGLGLTQPLYRWVDENGEVHYTDSVPATESKQGHTKLDERGLQTEVVPPAPTEAELQKVKERERLEKEEERRIAEQKEADERLLKRYRTSEEIELTREGKIAGIDALIQVKRDLIRATLVRRKKLETQKQQALKTGKPLPAPLAADIEKADEQIRTNYAAIVGMEYQKDAIRREFSELLEHYRKLRRLAAPADPGPTDSEPLANIGYLVICTQVAQCTSYWAGAMAYLREHSDPTTEIAGQGLLIGFQQDEKEERTLTLTWTQKAADSPVHLFFDLQCKNKQTGSLNCADASTLQLRDGFKAAIIDD